VHEEGFKIEKDFKGEWFFRRPDGLAISHGPVYSEIVSAETIDGGDYGLPDGDVSAETIGGSGKIEEPMAAYG